MRRRNFVASIGTAILGTGYVSSQKSEGAVVNFEIQSNTDADPTVVNSLRVSFSKLEIKTHYLDESSPINISVTINLGKYGQKQRDTTIQTVNGDFTDLSDEINGITIDNLDISNTDSLFGEIHVQLTHPELTESFKRTFSVSQPEVLLTDNFDDNSFDTSTWTKAVEQGTIEETNGEMHATAASTADNARILSTESYEPPLELKSDMQNDPNSNTGGYGTILALYNPNTGEQARIKYNQYYSKNHWHILTSDGENSENTILSDSSGEWRTYKIEVLSDRVNFYINGSSVGTLNTYLPTSGLKVRLEATRGSDASSKSDAKWDNLELRRL